MAKITSNTILILLYICFSLVLSKEIDYNGKPYEETVEVTKSIDYHLKFKSDVTKPDYIKIILTNYKRKKSLSDLNKHFAHI